MTNIRKYFCLFVFTIVLSVPVYANESPCIGIVYTSDNIVELESSGRDARALYRKAIEQNGGVVVVLGQNHPPAATHDKLQTLDGVLLPGGIDVLPAFYGESPHALLGETDAALDQFEFRVLDFARRQRLPVLGICWGHQVLNVYYGGSLIQDIPSEHQGTVEVVHRTPEKGGSWANHAIVVAEDSLLYQILGMKEATVNSSHHQAVKKLAEGFMVSARSKDGIIEAMEHSGEVFLVGLQWHPERMVKEDARMNGLFVRFLDEARRSREHRKSMAVCETAVRQ